MRKIKTYSVKGFTIAELLVVLALTSISITLSYGTLSYIQKLFVEYKKQNKFLNEFTDLKNRLDYESLRADLVTESQENWFVIRRDTSLATLRVLEDVILLKRSGRCDTFHISARRIKKEYELMENPAWSNKLVKKLQFETDFKKQVFKFSFAKDHEASVKLALDRK